jgi:uncharacterized protein (TIGR00730 family)
MRTFRRVAVFCGSSIRVPAHFMHAAEAVGALLAERGIGVVYGGGNVGLMGRVADAALAAGGEVIGVIPDKLRALELDHPGLTDLFVVDSMHARKAMMAHMSDAFIALPGGYGTLEEIFEVTTWTQLNYHHKPVGLLNVAGYYDALLTFIAHAVPTPRPCSTSSLGSRSPIFSGGSRSPERPHGMGLLSRNPRLTSR